LTAPTDITPGNDAGYDNGFPSLASFPAAAMTITPLSIAACIAALSN